VRETKYWTWFLIAGGAVFVLLGLHMIVMHLDSFFGWFNASGSQPTDWENVQLRAKVAASALFYVLLLGFALYHGLYGLRTILFELNLGVKGQNVVNALAWVVGVVLFVFGSWAAVMIQMSARVG